MFCAECCLAVLNAPRHQQFVVQDIVVVERLWFDAIDMKTTVRIAANRLSIRGDHVEVDNLDLVAGGKCGLLAACGLKSFPRSSCLARSLVKSAKEGSS